MEHTAYVCMHWMCISVMKEPHDCMNMIIHHVSDPVSYLKCTFACLCAIIKTQTVHLCMRQASSDTYITSLSLETAFILLKSIRISGVSNTSQYTKMWIAFAALLLGVIPPTLTVTTLPTSEVDTGSFGCPSPSMEQTVTDAFMDGIEAEVRQNILQTLQCRVGECESNPATSCQDVMDRGAAVTGTYWISKCDGTTTQVYCTMDNPCGCSGTGAWMRIGLLNMSDPTQQCHSGMGVINDPRSCSHNTQPGNCASIFFDSIKLPAVQPCLWRKYWL